MSSVLELTVKYAEVTSKLVQEMMQTIDRYESSLKAAEELVPTVSEALKTAGFIDSHEVKRAQVELGRHEDALQILQNVVRNYQKAASELRAKAASTDLGAAAGGDGSAPLRKQANWSGRRRGYDDGPAESDLALFRGLGLSLPSNH
jgi:hypothetical protein